MAETSSNNDSEIQEESIQWKSISETRHDAFHLERPLEDDEKSSLSGNDDAKRKYSDSYSSSEEEEQPTVKKPKFSFQCKNFASSNDSSNLTDEKKKNVPPITLKLGAQKTKDVPSVKKSSSASVAKAFNTEDDDEEEEMPPEAKMRMRNIGRDTPTSAGPNSFGKTRQGFCDVKKMFEKQIKKKMEDVSQ